MGAHCGGVYKNATFEFLAEIIFYMWHLQKHIVWNLLNLKKSFTEALTDKQLQIIIKKSLYETFLKQSLVLYNMFL